MSVGAVSAGSVRRRAALLGRACVDRRYQRRRPTRRLAREPRRHRYAVPRDRGAAATDASAISHTKAWLLAFEEELAKAADVAALNAAMKTRFPRLGTEVALDVGAKVATGEMKWG